MNKKSIYLTIAILFLGLIIYLLIPGAAQKEENERKESLALCLSENKVKMYGTTWCSYCQKQKQEFGKAFKKIEFIDCDRERDICLREGIQGYPTWKINGEPYSGLQTLETLATLSNCEY